MKSTTLKCDPCEGSGLIPGSKKWAIENQCLACEGYGYNHPEAGKRRLLSGEKFFFLNVWDDEPKEEWDARDYVDLNGGGCLNIGEAESYEPSFDRQKNFFFTRKEARKALSEIRKIINRAK